MRTALVLAPYSPIGSPIAALGAARKIRGVLAALQACFDQVVLVNSAHNEESRLPAAWDRLAIDGGEIPIYLPPRWGRRSVGKFRNLFGVKKDVATVLGHFPQPEIVWIYNAYAYETLFLREVLKCQANCKRPKVVLEIEDWPLARLRWGHPKPWLDLAGLRFMFRYADAVLCVNEALAKRVREKKPDILIRMFPGLVSEDILQISAESPPFQKEEELCIGYFGGLSEEKGCELLLEAIEVARDRNWRWLISGSGPMAHRFAECAKRYPNVSFHGAVSDEELVKLMGECDVIVNPHRPISEMGEGVFPFKVVESVATGRLVISTKLPHSGYFAVDAALRIFDGTLNGLVESLDVSRKDFTERKRAIQDAICQIQESLSVVALRKTICKWTEQ